MRSHNTIFLIEEPSKAKNSASALHNLLEDLHVDIVSIEPTKEAISKISEETPTVIIMGPHLDHPILNARHAYNIQPLAQLVIWSSERNIEVLKRDLSLAPRVGSNCHLATDSSQLPSLVRDGLRSTRQRRQMRTQIGHIQTQMGASSFKDSIEIDKLLISDRHLASVLAGAHDAIISTDLHGFVRSWNRAAERLFGYAATDVIGKPFSMLNAHTDIDALGTLLQRLKSGEQDIREEISCRRFDGTRREISFSFAMMLDERSHPFAFSIIGHDVTETQRLRAVTEGQKQVLEMSVNGASLASMLELLTDIMEKNSNEGVRASILLLSDDGTHLLHGAGPNLPKAYNDAIHGLEIGEGVGSCGTAAFLRTTYIASDIATDPYWVAFKELALSHGLRACWSTPLLDSKAKTLGTFALYYDKPTNPSSQEKELVEVVARTAAIIIEREHEMRARQANEEKLVNARNDADAANVAKSEFLANMSHEIRTPMNAIIGLGNILGRSNDLSPQQKQYVQTLQMSADTLLVLINDLLDIAKIEARSVELENIPFSLTRLIQEVMSMMAPRVKEKGLIFKGVGEDVRERTFVGDPSRLRQIILNLSGNAIKFTEKGTIEIGITCKHTDDPKIEQVCIAVKDSGIGIAKEKLDDIFQKFIQADSSISRKYGGTGLGLAITKTLTEIMGGTLVVESTLGAGSTFTACIPLALADEQTIPFKKPVAQQAVTSPMHKLRILLVEDYPANILVATTFLKGFGYDCDVVSNGSEAVEKIKAGKYGLVLMDVQMPGMNGFEATAAVREHERLRSLPRVHIMGMTAHALMGDRERCIAAGMDDYISKPFNPDELQTKLATFA